MAIDHRPHTHTVATLGIVLHGDRVLLLKRNTSPYIWAPPGGRLLEDEDPADGLRREIREETSICVEVLHPFRTWFGVHQGLVTLGIIYLCHYSCGVVTLSTEHTDSRWLTLDSVLLAISHRPDDYFGDHDLYRFAFALDQYFRL